MNTDELLAKLRAAEDFSQIAEVIGALKAEAARIRNEIEKREGSK